VEEAVKELLVLPPLQLYVYGAVPPETLVVIVEPDTAQVTVGAAFTVTLLPVDVVEHPLEVTTTV
jgi:hypothetical protein